MLKRIIYTFVGIIFILSSYAQKNSDILMTIGTNEVTVGEFKYIYEKNNGDDADYSKTSLDEYIDLYTKFKLKVEKAKEMKLDTIQVLKKELAGYRTQLANSFLTDKEVIDKLLNETIERKKQDVKISHILIKVKSTTSNEKAAKAISKLLAIKKELRNGKSFANLAKEKSEDRNTKKVGGNLGFITASLPSGFYDLENAAYELDVNEISDPIKTKLGYHLVKVLEKRPARGKIDVAHIFLKFDRNGRKELNKVKTTIDSIYNLLQLDADFAILAKKFSEDKTTKDKGGQLPTFGIGVYDLQFENAAFALKKDGEISSPIFTNVGFHIIKRIGKPAILSFEQKKPNFKNTIRKRQRYQIALDKMITRIKNNSHFTENNVLLSKFTTSLNSDFYSYRWKPSESLSNEKLLSFGSGADQSIMDFALYAKKQTRIRSQFDKSKPLPEAVELIYNDFVKDKAYEYEQANLESKYPEFHSLMREYQEGILLFEATKINVWDKANSDSLGLYNYYEKNKSLYAYEKRATVGKYIINTTDQKQIKKIMKCAKKHNSEKTLKRFNKDGIDMVEYSESTVGVGSQELKGLEFKKKYISEPVIDKVNNKTLFRKVVRINPPRRKSLKEARGYVVADYQDELEKKWISELRNLYQMTLNNKVYNLLLKK